MRSSSDSIGSIPSASGRKTELSGKVKPNCLQSRLIGKFEAGQALPRTILLFHVANRHCPVLCSASASNAGANGCHREERSNGCNTQRIYLRRGVTWQDACRWGDGPANIISVDDSVAHSRKNSVRMVRDGESAGRMIGDALDHLAQIEFRIDPRPTGSSCLDPGLDGIPSLNH
jgi:hypothetical protein